MAFSNIFSFDQSSPAPCHLPTSPHLPTSILLPHFYTLAVVTILGCQLEQLGSAETEAAGHTCEGFS